jgi:chorismate synthase
MNSFGRLFRITLFGESHGESIGVVINGCPAGLPLSIKDFSKDLRRRQAGAPGTTQRREPDIPIIKSGLYKSRTTGAPLFIMFENKDIQSEKYLSIRDTPRPGHADFVAQLKYGGYNDFRGSGHFSGRLTVGLVAAGVVAKKILAPAVVEASVTEVGGQKKIEETVESALKADDSIGGIVECHTKGLPVGLGEPFFDSVESLISHLVFAIPGIKGIEFGSGFACSRMRGSECNDIILNRKGRTKTNHAGGINGGITNGNELFFRAAVKPPSSIKKEQHTINFRTGKPVKITVHGRHDICIALRMPVIIEAVTAVVLADLSLIEQKIPRIMK